MLISLPPIRLLMRFFAADTIADDFRRCRRRHAATPPMSRLMLPIID